MRILLICPDSPDVNSIPEIRAISSKHHAMILNGVVTAQVIDQYSSQGYKAFHFAGHSTPDYVLLSNGEKLEADDIVRLARKAGADFLFFNSCDAGKLASYAVAHGIHWAVASTIKLQDADAWAFPSAFYNALANGAWRDIVNAFREADSGNGEYMLAIAPAAYADCEELVDELRTKMANTVVLRFRTLLFIVFLTLMAMATLALILVGLSGILH